jgi:short subunit fatty acids transporter
MKNAANGWSPLLKIIISAICYVRMHVQETGYTKRIVEKDYNTPQELVPEVITAVISYSRIPLQQSMFDPRKIFVFYNNI